MILMHNKLYILLIAAVLCLSCSKVTTEQKGDVQVNFSTTLDKATKVGSYFEAGDRLGVLGYNLVEGKTWNEAPVAPGFMYNEVLEYNGEKWSTLKEFYWSPRKENRKRFYAYYPHAENGTNGEVAISPGSHTGSPFIDFTVTDGKTDFITCSAEEGNVENPMIRFTAKHALAKLTIGFATDLEEGFAYVKATKVKGVVKNGKYTFDATGGNGFTYNSRQTVDLDLAQPAEDIVVSSNEAVYADEYTLYLLPLYENDGKGSVQEIETVINGVPKVFDLSSVPLASGKNTIVRIVINQKDVKFTAAIRDWETGGSASGTID